MSMRELRVLQSCAARPDYVHYCTSDEEWRRELTGHINASEAEVRAAIARRVDLETLPHVDGIGSAALGLALLAVTRSARGQSMEHAS